MTVFMPPLMPSLHSRSWSLPFVVLGLDAGLGRRQRDNRVVHASKCALCVCVRVVGACVLVCIVTRYNYVPVV